jgi:hypothetical protein
MTLARPTPAFWFPLALLAACAAAPRAPIAPLQGARPLELRLAVEPLSGPARVLEVPPERAGEGRLAVRVRVRWLAAPLDALAQAVGEQARSLFGVVCPREQARGLVGALLAEDVGGIETSEVVLGLQADEEGYMTWLNEQAYLAGFEVVAGRAEVIADPRVEVVQDGTVLRVRATRGPGAEDWTLALELTTVELDRPLAARTLELGGFGAPLTLQVPSGILRRLRCGASQAPDEALLLGGAALASTPRTAGTPLVLVELDPLAPGDEAIALR